MRTLKELTLNDTAYLVGETYNLVDHRYQYYVTVKETKVDSVGKTTVTADDMDFSRVKGNKMYQMSVIGKPSHWLMTKDEVVSYLETCRKEPWSKNVEVSDYIPSNLK